jgi:hypothetical protein
LNPDVLSYQRPPKLTNEHNGRRVKQYCKYHQCDFEKVRCDAHEHLNLSEHVVIERTESIVVRDAGEEIHQDQLTIALSTIAWLFLVGGLSFRPAFDDDNGWSPSILDHCDIFVNQQHQST